MSRSTVVDTAAPDVAVAVVLGTVGGRRSVLVVRRRGSDPKCPVWVFPGGKVGARETPQRAAKRELLEETGVHAGRWERIGERRHPLSGVKITYLAADYQSGDARAASPSEVSEVRWIPVADVPQQLGSTLFERVASYIQAHQAELCFDK